MFASLAVSVSPAFAVYQTTGNGGSVTAGGFPFPSATGGEGGALVENPQGEFFTGGFGSSGGGCGGRLDISASHGTGSCYSG